MSRACLWACRYSGPLSGPRPPTGISGADRPLAITRLTPKALPPSGPPVISTATRACGSPRRAPISPGSLPLAARAMEILWWLAARSMSAAITVRDISNAIRPRSTSGACWPSIAKTAHFSGRIRAKSYPLVACTIGRCRESAAHRWSKEIGSGT